MKIRDIDLNEIVELFGTPAYVIDFDRVRENFLRLHNAIKCPQ